MLGSCGRIRFGVPSDASNHPALSPQRLVLDSPFPSPCLLDSPPSDMTILPRGHSGRQGKHDTWRATVIFHRYQPITSRLHAAQTQAPLHPVRTHRACHIIPLSRAMPYPFPHHNAELHGHETDNAASLWFGNHLLAPPLRLSSVSRRPKGCVRIRYSPNMRGTKFVNARQNRSKCSILNSHAR